ncbi:TPA: hypothetical protein DEQ22_01850 [Candidatus Nomurabacteria bacterium]|uniref:Uncharacterized protein n=1 Tax=Candidatus Nomurabacteria bacterium RIFOXYA2_FULL_42_12 TaxID=1801801 RepID=A0A1F6YKT9_9BACT|nr:MAG: hypothetical protein UV23_C0039G0002 [Candidatus Nomurabacteria bacterium GW2011_GWF1_42_40]OGJ04655.1 MAG: hypothetical protein A2357_03500 [Candidatus Nomurabacteria bacterium RIFOXYB1_FULL_43_14]OGJ06993.1 MAG: hypothetical protein A2225_03270 [Candidatus Nomurabacteria bacterium RIFOXYA2_FULL_42_12]OGJ07146.1 MAG: hypothetical protein A2183_01730 [Candidatus Nomurabacteria bacterium RIFOXYA1_FULL_42_12]OGJ09754.1 MAG: hypothetical protein A2443_01665 [Candidatus Nomurabacteria bacte
MVKRTRVILVLIIVPILFLLLYPFPEKPLFNLDSSVLLEYLKVGGLEGHSNLKVFNDGSAKYQMGFLGNVYQTQLSSEDFNSLKQFIAQEKYTIKRNSFLSKWFLTMKGQFIMDFGISRSLVNHDGKTISIKPDEPIDLISDKIRSRMMEEFVEKAKAMESEEKQSKLFCDLIKNSQFYSVKQKGVGLGPDGPVMGYWTVSFSGNEVFWHHSDVAEKGIYSCYGDVINVKLILDDAFKVIYNSDRGVLSWQGDEYIKLVETNDVVCPIPEYTSPHCPKVITKARNLKTGEVKEFPDACLPECWAEY